MTSRTASYFAILIILIVGINTPIPRLVLTPLLGNAAGTSISQTLAGYTRDLFLLLLISIYFEWARARDLVDRVKSIDDGVRGLEAKVDSYLPSSLQEAIGQRLTPFDVLSVGLKRALRTEKPVVSASDQLILRGALLEDVLVAVRVEPHRDTGLFRVNSTMIAATDLPDVLVAVTKTGSEASALVAKNPSLFYVIVVEDARDPSQQEELVRRQLSISCQASSGEFREVELKLLSSDASRQRLDLPDGIESDGIALYSAQLPRLEGLVRRRKLRANFRYNLSKKNHLWQADRPMHVSQITVDVAAVTADDKRADFHFFIPDRKHTASEIVDGRLTLTLDSWIFSGHGVLVVWE